MTSDVEAVLSESWFVGLIRAIVAEFYMDYPNLSRAVIQRKKTHPHAICYGRYSLAYDASINTIYLVG